MARSKSKYDSNANSLSHYRGENVPRLFSFYINGIIELTQRENGGGEDLPSLLQHVIILMDTWNSRNGEREPQSSAESYQKTDTKNSIYFGCPECGAYRLKHDDKKNLTNE